MVGPDAPSRLRRSRLWIHRAPSTSRLHGWAQQTDDDPSRLTGGFPQRWKRRQFGDEEPPGSIAEEKEAP